MSNKQPSLDITPLVEYLETNPDTDVNTDIGAKNPTLLRAYHRAKRRGRITVTQADRIATQALELHPAEIWGLDTWTNA